MPMNARLLRPLASSSLSDADATAYLAAVEAADGQALEPAVRNAVTAFVIGCKSDGIWDSIKASCILAGARTLAGALVPLVGTAPTNNNFVAGDYSRLTGLTGNGSTKYLNTGISTSSVMSQNNLHMAAYSTHIASGTGRYISGDPATLSLLGASASVGFRARANNAAVAQLGSNAGTGFVGASRTGSADYDWRAFGSSGTAAQSSGALVTATVSVFATPVPDNYSSATISFYSFGEALNLALLDTRVAALITAIGAS